MIVLGLDLSKSRTGFALDGREGACPPRAGSRRTSGVTLGRLGFEYQEWLYEFAKTNRVELIAYEAPAIGSRGGKKDGERSFVMDEETSIALIGMAFATETIAHALGVRCERAHVQTVRKFLVGHGRPPNPKRAVMERCRLLGWPAPNTDATDALAVWAWAKAGFDRSFRLEATTPLFSRAAQ
jgi:hypothetical protein